MLCGWFGRRLWYKKIMELTNTAAIVFVGGIFFMMVAMFFGMRQVHRANVATIENKISKLLKEFSKKKTFLHPYYFEGIYNEQKLTIVYSPERNLRPSVEIKCESKGTKHKEVYSDEIDYQSVFNKLTA
jgi:hypothetical protein